MDPETPGNSNQSVYIAIITAGTPHTTHIAD